MQLMQPVKILPIQNFAYHEILIITNIYEFKILKKGNI